jgi:hypothetical protein
LNSNFRYKEELIKNHRGLLYGKAVKLRVSQRKKLKIIRTPCHSVYSVVKVFLFFQIESCCHVSFKSQIKVSSAITDY